MWIMDLRTAEGRWLFGYNIGRAGKPLTGQSIGNVRVPVDDPDMLAGYEDGALDFETWINIDE